MSRFEGNIGEDGASAVDIAEIFEEFVRQLPAAGQRRKGAVARYLSASEGWREASSELGGAFACEDGEGE